MPGSRVSDNGSSSLYRTHGGSLHPVRLVLQGRDGSLQGLGHWDLSNRCVQCCHILQSSLL